MTNNSLNSYGVPLHACNGYKQDEHYWAYIGEKNKREKQYQKACIKAKELGIL